MLTAAAATPAHENAWDLARGDTPPIPLLAYEPSSFLGMVVESTVGGRPMNTETIYIDELVETIKRRVLKGSGFAWIPETAISDELADGRLVSIGDETWRARLTIVALANPLTFDPIVREIWDLL